MRNTSRYLLWDFDNTLAHRPGLWSQCLADIVNVAYPEKKAVRGTFAPYLSRGFPWHRPEVCHSHLSTSDLWWSALAPTLEEALRLGAGVDQSEASDLAAKVRSAQLDATRWVIFEDTVPALELVAEEGWNQVILSNHMPELPELVAALGLGKYFTAIHTSGTTGFEKPHPRAYAAVLESLGSTPGRGAMIGDSYPADFVGPRTAGLEAVLVRSSHPQCDTSFSNLIEAARFITGRT
jgi:putative hydrolase of the HAD superfamily